MTIECIYRFPFQRHYEPNSAYENYIDTEREEEYPWNLGHIQRPHPEGAYTSCQPDNTVGSVSTWVEGNRFALSCLAYSLHVIMTPASMWLLSFR